MRKSTVLFLFCLLGVLSASPQTNCHYRVWFDHDVTTAQTGTADSGTTSLQLDVNHLSEGLHQLTMMLLDGEGNATSIRNSYFFRIKETDPAMKQDVKCYYAFDHSSEYAEAQAMGGGSYKLGLDAGGLDEGLHQLNVRLVAANGEVVCSRNSYFFRIKEADPAMKQDVKCYYAFDHSGEYAEAQTMGGGSYKLGLDAGGLDEGLHQLNVRLVAANGEVVCSRNSYFFRIKEADPAMKQDVKCYYAFDHSDEYAEAQAMGGGSYKLGLDAGGLDEGLHQLNVRLVAANGEVVCSRNSYFFRTKEADPAMKQDVKCYYAFDHSGEYAEAQAMGGGSYKLGLDAGGLDEGLHQLNVRLVAANGEVVCSRNSYFFRTKEADPAMKQDVKCYYAFDHSGEYAEAQTMGGGSYKLNIDVDGLSRGMHQLNMRLVASNGEVVSIRNSYFAKVESEGQGIAGYEYWVNGQYKDKVRVPLQTCVGEYSLVENLAIPTYPFDVKSIIFESVDGKPMVYNRNCITVSFFTSDNLSVQDTATYIDETTRMEILSMSIGRGDTITRDAPEKHEILWYHIDALAGDSIALSSERECTIEMYSADGKVIYRTVGTEAASSGGLSVADAGRYYVALHSVTDSLSTKVSLIYSIGAEEIDESHMYVTVAVVTPGTLEQLIIEKAGELENVRELVVSGNLNSDDMACIARMTWLESLSLDEVEALTVDSDTEITTPLHLNIFGFVLNDAEEVYPSLTCSSDVEADSVWVADFMKANQWTFLSLPFSVNVDNISCDDPETQYVIRRYDSAGRAAGKVGNWQNVSAGSTLTAGEAFIVHHNARSGVERFTFPASIGACNIFADDNVTVTLQAQPSAKPSNSGWNHIGNPYPAYYDMGQSGYHAPVTVWNGEGYDTYVPGEDELVLHPFEAFFVQKPEGVDEIVFAHDRHARQEARERSNGSVINICVGRARTRVVINEEASRDYDLGMDAAKFFGTSFDLYTIENGIELAINERPLDDGIVRLGYVCPQTGRYTLCIDDSRVVIVDKETGTENRGTYTFNAEAGRNTTRFELRIHGDADGIGGVASETRAGHTYTTSGMKIDSKPVGKGVYIRDGKKVVIR